ncbi:hypothetical protein ACJ41O_011995 [Fusarium nematophilum]
MDPTTLDVATLRCVAPLEARSPIDVNLLLIAYAHSPEDIVIAVMGLTRTGKSTFIEKVTSQKHLHIRLSPERRVYLVDTPGFDDTCRNDTEILKEVAFFLSQIYKNNVKLAGIIYLHRITDNRVAGAALKNLNMFKHLCGNQAFGHVVLATSMWDTLDAASFKVGDQREEELISRAEFWGAMHKGGSKVTRWAGNEDSARKIVSSIIDVHDKLGKAVLKIQDELVNGNMALDETTAGQEVQKEILAAKTQLKDEIEQLRQMHADMMRDSDEAMAKELASQQLAFEEQLQETNKAQEMLRTSMQDLMEEKTAEYGRLLSAAVDEQRRLGEALTKKEAEYEKERQARAEDEETSRDAEAYLMADLTCLKRKMEEKEGTEEQRRVIKEEMQLVKELQEELRHQQKGEIDEAARRKGEMEADIQARKDRRESMKHSLGLLGVLAGLGTMVLGVTTMNPALVGMGVSMTGSTSGML